jgi:hypothetical protein
MPEHQNSAFEKQSSAALSPDEIAHELSLLRTHRDVLLIYLQQQAIHGPANTPPATLISIDEARHHIHNIKNYLRAYGVEVRDERIDAATELRPPTIVRGYVEVVLNGTLSNFTPDIQRATIGALAGILDIPADQISIVQIQAGSIILRFEMPVLAIHRLMELRSANDPRISALGIQTVTPIPSISQLNPHPSSISTPGEHVITIGRDVVSSLIVSGDHNTVLLDNATDVSDAYIDPSAVFARLNLDYFAGREWLLTQINSFVSAHQSGYFIIEAQAGLGKTTFLAWLVRQYGYIHHFSELAPGSEGIGDSLRNLAAQLTTKYGLGSTGNPAVLSDSASRPHYLSNLLKQASERRAPMQKIILVIDALDEAGTPDKQNVLGLPRTLPQGVYCIVSKRPIPVRLRIDATPRQIIKLGPNSAENLADMQAFLVRVAGLPDIASSLADSQLSAQQFAEILMEKSQGVWTYLHYIIEEIKQGRRSTLALDTLPDGLTEYYLDYWRRWRDNHSQQWYPKHLPLLTTLATTKDPLNIAHLIAWSGANLSAEEIRELLEEQWRHFIVVISRGQQDFYRYYHATLRELFQIPLKQQRESELTEDNQAFLSTLQRAMASTRSRVFTQLRRDMREAPDNALRREAAFWLIHMNWLAYVGDVSPDEIEEHLNLIAPYIDAPDPRRYLVTHIDAALKLELSTRQCVQLLIYGAAMHGQLGNLPAAAEYYDKAKTLIDSLIGSPHQLPSDLKLAARINLGLANIACIEAEQIADLDQQEERFAAAVALYKDAARAAHKFGQDIQLEMTILKELIYTYTLNAQWTKARAIHRYALKILTCSSLQARDRIAYTSSYAQLLETVSQMHFEKANRLSTEQDAAARLDEYRTAHRVAQEEIDMLKTELDATEAVELIHDLALAHINAGDYLLAIGQHQPHGFDDPLGKAREHWQIALDLAQQYDIEDRQQEAIERLAKGSA